MVSESSNGGEYEEIIDILAEMFLAWGRSRKQRRLDLQAFLRRVRRQIDREDEEEAEREWLARILGTRRFRQIA